MDKSELINQTQLAFDLIHKLHLEVSYLIKEMEGLLSEEDEHFMIGRPSGYQVTARSSSGLEPYLINFWIMRKMSVFFVSEKFCQVSRGQTITDFSNNLRVIYVRIALVDKEISQPTLHAGVLYEFEKSKFNKFEKLMGHLEYAEAKVFNMGDKINYEDSYIAFKGDMFRVNLYDIHSSEEIVGKVINPALEIYRRLEPTNQD